MEVVDNKQREINLRAVMSVGHFQCQQETQKPVRYTRFVVEACEYY
jgi:hypothetical protein